MTSEILNIRGKAGPGLAHKAAYSTAQRGHLPAFQVRGEGRIRHGDLGARIAAQRLAMPPKEK